MIVVKFYTPTCGSCKIMDKITAKVLPDFPNVEYSTKNLANDMNTAKCCNIVKLPTLIRYNGYGAEICRLEGAVSESKLREFFNEH